jgi:hypothetical protein
MSHDDDDKAKEEASLLKLAFGTTKFEDDMLHTVLLLRDRNNRNAAPVPMTIMDMTSLRDMVQAASNEVHYLFFSHKGVRIKLKVSYLAKLKQFNFHYGTEGVVESEMNSVTMRKLSSMPIAILSAISEELND